MALIVVDAGVVIAVLDATDAHHSAAVIALAAARDRGDELMLPASAYAEILVGAFRAGSEAPSGVDAFVDALPARVEPATREIARVAASLRAANARLRLPDALVVATAIERSAAGLLTTDSGWPDLPIPVSVVSPAVGS